MSSSQYNLPDLIRCKGFTILELLIAISLSTILMTVLVVGLNTITRDWEKLGNKLDEKIDDSLLLLQLEKAILGTYSYRFREHELAKNQLFFEGSKMELSWVSTVSPQRNSSLNFWHLEADESNGFKLTILPVYPGDLNKQLEQAQSREKDPIRYFEDYKVSLHYLTETLNEKKQWASTWSGEDKNILPLGIKIQFKQDNELDQNSDFYVFSFIRVSSETTSNAAFGGGSEDDIPIADPNSNAGKNPLFDVLK